jgi:UDP-galactopyranose mutase
MNILVVGAGLAGATVARVLADAGHTISVIEKRSHIAGNAYDYKNKHGIRVHKYGSHIFHTSNEQVWNFLSRFTEWTPYKHKVKALLADGRYATLPVNRETKEMVGAENVLDIFIRPYTLKMWGMPIEKLDPSIMNRVPIRDDDNEFYFPNDTYQALPTDGYTAMVKNMLDSPNITVDVNLPFARSCEPYYDHVFNSMPIDEYYDFKFGELPYRSVKFENVHLPLPRVFPTSVVNFTHNGPHTRVTEWKNYPVHGVNDEMTTLTFETPCDYKDNNMERYYPVKDLDGKNREIYKRYDKIENKKVTFIGRCGTYQYLDMWMVIAQTQKIAREFLERKD